MVPNIAGGAVRTAQCFWCRSNGEMGKIVQIILER